MNSSLKLAFALCVFAPLAAQAVPTTNLTTNGSFETLTRTTIGGNQWTVVESNQVHDSPHLKDWQAEARSGVELRNKLARAAKKDNVFAELDSRRGYFSGSTQMVTPCCDNWISQTAHTAPDQVSRLSYWYSPRGGVGLASNDIAVYWNGFQLKNNIGSDSGTSGNDWTSFEFDVTSAGGRDTLKFVVAGGTADASGGSLDNVSLVAAVPEPETYSLMMAGLGAVAFMARRRKSN